MRIKLGLVDIMDNKFVFTLNGIWITILIIVLIKLYTIDESVRTILTREAQMLICLEMMVAIGSILLLISVSAILYYVKKLVDDE